MARLTRRELLSATPLRAFLHAPRGEFAIHPRSDWAIHRPPKGPMPAEDVRFLVVHHSASRNGHTGADAPAILRSFYDYHTGPKGWNDIAYNFLIDADGGIWEGRFGSLDGPVAGDATGGNQGFTQLVCIIGDYNVAHPSAASLDSLVWLLAWLADRYGVSTAPGAEVTFVSRGSNLWSAGAEVATPTITGHRNMSKTTCPGDNLYVYVAGDLTADVDALRVGTALVPSTTTTTSIGTTTTAPASTMIPTIEPPRAASVVPPVAAPQPSSASAARLWPVAGAGLAGVLGVLFWRYQRLTRR